MFDRPSQDLDDRTMQVSHRYPRHPSSRASRAYPGLPERLTRVDVSNPCDAALVEQQYFYRRCPSSKHSRKGFHCKAWTKGFETEGFVPGLVSFNNLRAAEFAHVAEGESDPAIEVQDEPSGRGSALAGAQGKEPARHSQLHDQPPAGAEEDHNGFPSAADARDAFLDERAFDAHAAWNDDVFSPAHLD